MGVPMRSFCVLAFLALGACAHTPEITLATIAEECESREGNVLALKEFSKEIVGYTLSLDAHLTTIDQGGARSRLLFLSDDWRLNVSASDSVAVLLRRGEAYHLTATIDSSGWSGGLGMWDHGAMRCNGDIYLSEAILKR